VALLIVAVAPIVRAEDPAARRVPFWPDDVPAAIRGAIDGRAALETVRDLGRYHRVHGSPGFAAAAEMMRGKAEAAGLSDAVVEHFPAHGHTSYAHFRSYLGWDPKEASLEEVEPRHEVIARFPALPVALADYSQDADITGALVDVGAGTREADYAGREVTGRLVLASGALPAVHDLAVIAHGAAGILSDFPNQTTAWSGDDRDLVRWGHLSPYETRNRFAFRVSKRQSDALRERLARGERIVLAAHVRARMVPATFDIVTAQLPGTDPAAGEIVLTAHLCHESAGANDNASGSAAILEAGRALATAVARGALPRPRRTIRFLWVPEIAGSEVWLVRHPEEVPRIVAGVHMDMVGGRLDSTHGSLHVSRSVASLPHVVNAIAGAFLAEVLHASAAYAEDGGDPAGAFVWLPGSRDALVADFRQFELGSDGEVFSDGTFGVPMVYLHDWPDVTIHTNKDVPENLDATKLGRAAYLGAGIAWTLAALPDAEVPRLVAVASADAERDLAAARLRAALSASPRDGALAVREAAVSGAAVLETIGRLWPSGAALAHQSAASLSAAATIPPIEPSDADRRVPVRSPDVRGPLDVYYFDTLADRLPKDGVTGRSPTSGGSPDAFIRYEALNLVDGKRSVSAIRDVLAGRYSPLGLDGLGAWFDLRARARVVTWK
jgi:hypothetical protein